MLCVGMRNGLAVTEGKVIARSRATKQSQKTPAIMIGIFQHALYLIPMLCVGMHNVGTHKMKEYNKLLENNANVYCRFDSIGSSKKFIAEKITGKTEEERE